MLIEEYNPWDTLIRIHRLKLKASILPLLIIIACFILDAVISFRPARYVSLAGLILYFLVVIRFRIRKTVPPEAAGKILAPVSGRVTEIGNLHVIISKSIFRAADIRIASADPRVQIEFCSGKPIIFEHENGKAGNLIGIAPGRITCLCQFPADYNVKVTHGSVLTAGESILAENES
ncbi:MAG: hypothetical protein JW784_00985 [Candidatus Cloacimonetes bacterium]|nr:hypothetical protein [Candidatus Cloacimonadota bacterium]